jgi:2,5-diamino-6-hydroxy-4-(5-phosphoribosylamino)pyrimidine 1'-reductase
MYGKKSNKPYVVVGGFMSLDGKTAPRNRQGMLFTQFMDQKLNEKLHKIRASMDAILVGMGTILIDNPRLTVRYSKGKNPTRVVLDSTARTPLNSAILNVEEANTIIFVSEQAPKNRVQNLKKIGVEIRRCGTKKIDISKMLKELYGIGIRKLLVEGGSEVRWSFFKEKAVDELFVWIIPTIWGGKDAPTYVDGEGFIRSEDAVTLRLKKIEQIDKILNLEFFVESS